MPVPSNVQINIIKKLLIELVVLVIQHARIALVLKKLNALNAHLIFFSGNLYAIQNALQKPIEMGKLASVKLVQLNVENVLVTRLTNV